MSQTGASFEDLTNISSTPINNLEQSPQTQQIQSSLQQNSNIIAELPGEAPAAAAEEGIAVPENISSNGNNTTTTTTTTTTTNMNATIELCDDDAAPSCSIHAIVTENATNVNVLAASNTSQATSDQNDEIAAAVVVEEAAAMALDEAAAVVVDEAAAVVNEDMAGFEEEAAAAAAPILECPICLLTCVHPTRLPCGHIFCYLCVKGVANKNHRCAMCRRNIPAEFLEHPQLVNGTDDICSTKATDDGYQWFYEGRNGWWQYDDRTSQDIEEAYKKGEKSCTILVAGYVYIVDLEAMLQQRQNEPSRCRRVKRDLATIPKKGVAGLRIEGGTVVTSEGSSSSSTGNSTTQVFYQQPQEHHHQQQPRGHFGGQQQSPHLMLPLDYIDANTIELDVDSTNDQHNSISTIAATDAAIRIASDIIGSTLAHADELTRRRSSMPTLASDIVAANSSSSSSSSNNRNSNSNRDSSSNDGGGRTPHVYDSDNYRWSTTSQLQRRSYQRRRQQRQQQQQLLFCSMKCIFKEFFVNIFDFYKNLFTNTVTCKAATDSDAPTTMTTAAAGIAPAPPAAAAATASITIIPASATPATTMATFESS